MRQFAHFLFGSLLLCMAQWHLHWFLQHYDCALSSEYISEVHIMKPHIKSVVGVISIRQAMASVVFVFFAKWKRLSKNQHSVRLFIFDQPTDCCAFMLWWENAVAPQRGCYVTNLKERAENGGRKKQSRMCRRAQQQSFMFLSCCILAPESRRSFTVIVICFIN